ncbi:hypothetical protein [Haliangium ochraceum]|uniref:Uncharacterized protein n=1 Tax=Haliangium ochraceum (strain DSM 14365 / JCM 11303 / SMP-2) TaxID=502025 RepID=D0LIS6_HALO1|nr:hypothetical protein [Haliangium ochraceum]ACY12955.1 hypothetical protein Hoch_0314 [Haliangium ochraceum DSM 14365]
MDKKAATAPPKSDSEQPVRAPQGPAGDAELTGADVTSNRKGSGDGWRWEGERNACIYLVDRQCFDDRAAACSAAGCAGSDCRANTEKAVPAKVSCKGAD